MANLLQRLGGGSRSISTIDDYALAMAQYQMAFQLNGIQSTYGDDATVERIASGFPAMAQSAYRANGIVFACMMVRQLVFSSARFRYQRMRNGAGSDLFSTAALAGLDRPAPGETTQDLLGRMIQDADLEGNSYHIPTTPLVRLGNGDPTDTVLLRLRPDWVDIVTKPLMYVTGDQRGVIGQHRFAYVYTEGGDINKSDPVILNPADVAHFAPLPDPLANFRGMSWLTPVIREIQNDGLMNRHKERFFTKGGTPNVVIKHADGAKKEAVLEWAKKVQAGSNQPDAAYKTLNLYPGADATVIGSNMRELDFKAVQGAGETRIAAAAGVPPIIVGLSEGLESATYSNYAQARRRFADGTLHPLWTNAAGSLEQIITTPGTDTRLWYDVADVPFLREDEKDAADIAATKAATISSLITAGYEPESVVLAVDADDLRLLKHTGLFSVQLQAPGAQAPAPPAP